MTRLISLVIVLTLSIPAASIAETYICRDDLAVGISSPPREAELFQKETFVLRTKQTWNYHGIGSVNLSDGKVGGRSIALDCEKIEKGGKDYKCVKDEGYSYFIYRDERPRRYLLFRAAEGSLDWIYGRSPVSMSTDNCNIQ